MLKAKSDMEVLSSSSDQDTNDLNVSKEQTTLCLCLNCFLYLVSFFLLFLFWLDLFYFLWAMEHRAEAIKLLKVSCVVYTVDNLRY